MNSFSILKFGVIHQTIRSIVPTVSNIIFGRDSRILLRSVHHMCERQHLNLIPNTVASNNKSSLLQLVSPTINLVSGLKVKGRLQLRCEHCYKVARNERWYIMCKKSPKHKQVQIKKREYKTWILTHATQSPKRPW
ncbi:hypothetical protein V1478_017963 [Vespula squamosa]|uniref:Large ribosomal subunit protein bL36m n=1 Tax=Vespula squamosa TaxID=30214 RepID=A0ABD1ZVP5_VESSQ